MTISTDDILLLTFLHELKIVQKIALSSAVNQECESCSIYTHFHASMFSFFQIKQFLPGYAAFHAVSVYAAHHLCHSEIQTIAALWTIQVKM